MNYKNDVIYLLKYNEKKDILEVVEEKINNLYIHWLDKYEKDLLKKDSNYVYSLYDFENMINTLNMFSSEIIDSDKKKLNKAYCNNLSGSEDDKIIYLVYLRNYTNFLKANPKANKHELLNIFFSEISSRYQKNKDLSKAIKGFIEKSFYELEYITRCVSFNQFEKDNLVWISSHRIKGFNSETLQSLTSKNDFEVRIRTNFGFGKKSFFKIKVYYKDNEIISFDEFVNDAQLVDNYLIEYSPKYDNWKYVLNYIKEISNMYVLRKNDFFIFIIQHINDCIKHFEKIIEQDIIKQNYYIKDFFYQRCDSRNILFYKITKLNYLINHIKSLSEEIEFINIDIEITKIQNLVKKMIQKMGNEAEIINKEILKITEEEILSLEISFLKKDLEQDLKEISDKLNEFKLFLLTIQE